MRLTTKCPECKNHFACCSKCGYPEPNLESIKFCPYCGLIYENEKEMKE